MLFPFQDIVIFPILSFISYEFQVTWLVYMSIDHQVTLCRLDMCAFSYFLTIFAFLRVSLLDTYYIVFPLILHFSLTPSAVTGWPRYPTPREVTFSSTMGGWEMPPHALTTMWSHPATAVSSRWHPSHSWGVYFVYFISFKISSYSPSPCKEGGIT